MIGYKELVITVPVGMQYQEGMEIAAKVIEDYNIRDYRHAKKCDAGKIYIDEYHEVNVSGTKDGYRFVIATRE